MRQFLDNLDFTSTEMLVAVLAFASVLFIGVSILFIVQQRRKMLRERLLAGRSQGGPLAEVAPSRLLAFVEKVGNVVSHGHASMSLWEQLIQAGYLGRGAPAVYTGVKIVLFLLGIILTALLVIPGDYDSVKKVSLISMGGAVMFFVPNLFIILQKNKRQKEIQHHLPDAVDLLEISVSSGVGLDMAWNLVADEIDDVSPVLGAAMDMSNFEMHLGATRTDALRNMARRTGADQLSSLAAILVQSERFGTSMALALREFAEGMRDERRLRAEEHAERMAVKLIGPMVLFIFPAIIIVMVGPAIVNIAEFFMSM
jgi:tight adherence protein C